MKSIFQFILGTGFGKIIDLVLDLIRIEMTAYFIRGVDKVRQFFTIGLLSIFCLMLMMSGFLLVHVALFILLPWSLWVKGLGLLILGTVYLFVPMGMILWLHSRRRWLKLSGVN